VRVRVTDGVWRSAFRVRKGLECCGSLGAPGWVATRVEAKAALKEAHGEDNDEGEEWAEDPASDALEDEKHRFSGGEDGNPVSLTNITEAIKG
jgi:hypothetical protein